MQKLIIIGAGSTGKRIYEFVKSYGLFDVIGFALEPEYVKSHTGGGGKITYFSTDELTEICRRENALVFAAVFWNMLNRQRRELYERMKSKGLEFANIISPSAVIRGKIEGGNCWINDYAVIQSGAVVKADTFIMDGALIGNMAVVNEHCHIGAHSVVCGSAVLGEQCFTGVNSVIFDGVRMGKRCVAGACSAVKRDMPDNTVCKINSESFTYRTYDEGIIESKLLVTSERRKMQSNPRH